MSDDDEPTFGAIGPIPVPAGIGRALLGMAQEHDRDNLRRQDLQHRLTEFLYGLTEDQCRMLRFILGGDNAEQTLAYNNRIDGRLVEILLTRHNVLNPDGFGDDVPEADE